MKYHPNHKASRSFYFFIPLIFIFSVTFNISAFSQQLSVGGVYNPNQKALWLKADQLIGLQNGDLVSNWPDASIHGHSAFQTDESLRPKFIASSPVFNNQPAVEFSTSRLRVNDHPSLDGMPSLTVISVLRNTSPGNTLATNQGIISKTGRNGNSWHNTSWALFFKQGNRELLTIAANDDQRDNRYDFYNEAMIHSAVLGFNERLLHYANSRFRGTTTHVLRNALRRVASAPLTIGNLSQTNSEWLNGEIAEIIVLREAINPAQRLIVEMVLASKYGITLKQLTFTQTNFANQLHSGFRNDIIGIGGINTENANFDLGYQKHSANIGSGGGLYLSEVSNSIDQPNEFVFAGHNNPGIPGWVTSDLPSGPENEDITGRWNRVWNIIRTIPQNLGNGTSVRLGFDFEETGLPIDNQSSYVLLYRENSTGEFTRLSTSGAAGNRVVFTLSNEQFSQGYYTIARTNAVLKTWTSMTSGPWNSPVTWGEAIGYPGHNGIQGRADNIVILNNHTVTISENGLIHGDILLEHGGKLIIGETRNHSFNTIRGRGKMEITGDYFPFGDASLFNGMNGGTVSYNGALPYVFNEFREYFNLEFDLGTANNRVNILKNLTVNGDLTINRGKIVINNNILTSNLTIRVNNDLIVNEAGTLLTGEGNAHHRLIVQGDFTNNGVTRFSNLSEPSYWVAPSNGKTDIIFNNPSISQTAQINGLTEFYRIEIEKNNMDSLFLRASSPNLFHLFGPNNFLQQGWASNKPNDNALGLLSGIVVVEDNIHIPKLYSNPNGPGTMSVGDYIIDLGAQIVINGGKIEARGDINSITIIGRLTILDGELKLTTQEGLHLRNSGIFDVRGGLAEISMFRTSGAFGNHRGAYMQSGGTVVVNGVNETSGYWGNGNFYRFTLPYESNIFHMTGGELIITEPMRSSNPIGENGGVLIASHPDNFLVTGGTVTLIINDQRNFIINSSVPFYNLVLRNISTRADLSFRLDSYSGGGTGGGLDSPPPAVAAHPLRVINLFDIQNGVNHSTRLNLNGHEIILNGDFQLNNFTELIANTPNSTFTVSGTGNNDIRFFNNQSIVLNNLIISKTSSTDTVSIRRLDYNNPITVDNNLSVTKGVVNYNQAAIHLKGNLTIDGTLGVNYNFGRLIMNGASEQTIEVINAESFSQIGHLELDNFNGVQLVSNSIDVIGNLTLNNGVFNIGNHGVNINGTIIGSGFGPGRMIATSGVHSNEGLSVLLSANQTLHFPIGTVGQTSKYTPLEATFANVQGPFYIRVNPVNQRLSTLNSNNPDESLNYYWRIRYTNINGSPLPTVSNYTFTFENQDLPPSYTGGFVPGKIVNLVRSSETADNFNLGNSTITFNEGFFLEQGAYTAGLESTFEGSILVYYSHLTDETSTSPLNWNDFNSWNLNGEIPTSLPGTGDLVVIGNNPGGVPHRVSISTHVAVGGLMFKPHENPSYSLPELIVDENLNNEIKLGLVSGEGFLVYNLSDDIDNAFFLEADFTEFDQNPRSTFVFMGSQPGTTYQIRLDKTTYPSIRFKGPEAGSSATFVLPQKHLIALRSFRVKNNSRVLISASGATGNLTVHGDLILGESAAHTSILEFPANNPSRTVTIGGDLIVNGTNSFIGVSNSPNNVIHNIILRGNLIQNNGNIVFYHSLTAPRVILELTGAGNAHYSRVLGQQPRFFRIVMNKGNNYTSNRFTFNHNFILNDNAQTPTTKPLTLVNGSLELAGEGTEVHLIKNGGITFEIPSSAGLILRSNAIAYAHAGYNSGSHSNYDHEGITLKGLLRLSESAQLLMADGTVQNNHSKSHIQYGSSGFARLEISNSARLEVASNIRGILDNPSSNLKYLQTGGTVLVGVNANLPHYPYQGMPGVFEITNPGSSFIFTGGTLAIVRGMNPEPGNNRESLFIHTSESEVGPNAILQLGIQNPKFNTLLRTISVSSTVSLPNVEVRLGNTVRVDFDSDLTIIGNLTIAPSARLFVKNSNINIYISGDYTNNGNAEKNNSIFHFNGVNQEVRGTANIQFNDLRINSSQEFRINRNINVRGNVHLTNTTFNDNGNQLSVDGNIVFLNSQHFSVSPNTGGIRFSGSLSQQNIIGSGFFGRLVIDNQLGVIANQSQTINGSLGLNNGFMDIGNNLLTIGPNATIVSPGYSPNQMIRTSGSLGSQGLRIFISNIETYHFPIGTNNQYTPVFVSLENAQQDAFIQIANRNFKHPAAPLNGNLMYYWNVESNGLLNFTGQIAFYYDQLSVENINDEQDYIPARLTDLNWIKLNDKENLMDTQLNKILFPYTAGVSSIAGEYTAGGNIPDEVLRFRTISSGVWSDLSIWENVPNSGDPADVPENGPFGQIIEISEGHEVSTGDVRRIAYQSVIDGTLVIEQTAGLPHLIGTVTAGSNGRLVLRSPTLPLGIFNSFANTGTFEYNMNLMGNYSLDPARYPQNGVNNLIFSGNGNWRLPAGTFRVNNNLNITDQASVDLTFNNPTVEIKGNFSISSPAKFFSGTGNSRIVMNGSGLQQIVGDFSGDNRLRNLEINNPTGVQILGITEISNNLLFVSGKVFTHSQNGILRLLNTATISGSSFNRYVEGPLQKRGNNNFDFHVGDNNRRGSITFRPENPALWNQEIIIEARYYQNNNFFNSPNVETPLAKVSGVEYWSLRELNNQSGNEFLGIVELYFDDEQFSGISYPTDLRVGWYNSSLNMWQDKGGSFLSNPNKIRSSISTPMQQTEQLFTFAVTQSGLSQNPLPIELLSFSAKLQSDKVHIYWSTASEINNDYFTLERSIDGINFEIIAYITGAGNSNQIQHYHYYDDEPHYGISYYRLKQTDFDGTFEYSETIAIKFEKRINHQSLVYPVPVSQGYINIQLSDFGSNEKVQIILSDMTGKVIRILDTSTDLEGYLYTTIHGLQDEIPGIYLIAIQSKDNRTTKRIVII